MNDRGTMDRIGFVLVGAVVGLAWAASLRAMMMAVAGTDSHFTFSGTFGIILPTGVVVGALLGWAEHQRRTGPQHGLLVLTPLLIGLVPLGFTPGIDPAPIGLALLAMVGGYSVSGQGPLWARIVAGSIALADVAVPFLAPKPTRSSAPPRRTAPGSPPWRHPCTSTLALASSIPMRRPDTARNPGGTRESPPAEPVAHPGMAAQTANPYSSSTELR